MVLGRPCNEIELAMRVGQLCAGEPFANLFDEVASSSEAAARADRSAPAPEAAAAPPLDGYTPLWRLIIRNTYERVLFRTPAEVEVDHWVGFLGGGESIDAFLGAVLGSDEAKIKRRAAMIGPDQSDGAFIVTAGSLLHGRGLGPQEVVTWQGVLDEQPARRETFVKDLLNGYLTTCFAPADDEARHDPSSCQMMGSTKMLTKALWDARRAALAAAPPAPTPMRTVPKGPPPAFAHTGTYAVSMIASLYKGAQYIRPFLENITGQSLFASAELIIVDAASPEDEREVIEAYAAQFPNIVYHRINHRIGIYDAWNVGVGMARGRYLTNTNLDDVRRSDSIEIQAATLDANPDVDVVYQDFYYSFEPNLTFDEIAAAGFKSELPVMTPHNFLTFNSPHNAPMWRARLHDDVGLFNTRYRSAGDYEFWARCLVAGKRFRKVNTVHVGYYQNPHGISTRPDTAGIREGREMLAEFGPKLISASLLQSRQDIVANLGLDQTVGTTPRPSYYDLAQTALLQLGERRRAEPASVPAQLGAATPGAGPVGAA